MSNAHVIRVEYDVVRVLGVIWYRTRFGASVELDGRATEVHLSVDGVDPCSLLVWVLRIGCGGVATGEELLCDEVGRVWLLGRLLVMLLLMLIGGLMLRVGLVWVESATGAAHLINIIVAFPLRRWSSKITATPSHFVKHLVRATTIFVVKLEEFVALVVLMMIILIMMAMVLFHRSNHLIRLVAMTRLKSLLMKLLLRQIFLLLQMEFVNAR